MNVPPAPVIRPLRTAPPAFAVLAALALAVLAALALGVLAAVPAAARAATSPRPSLPAPDASPFEWRGIVEGFYGKPWTHGERSRVIRWMGRHGFNAYVHAPKDDDYQTLGWRRLYPPSDQRNFDREIALAASLGVQWIPSVSPARGDPADPERVCFSCPGDIDTMLAKLAPFLAGGATTVMISFDDIVQQLGPADTATYGTRHPGTPPEYQFGRATADYLDAVLSRLPAGTGMLTVLPDYAGTTDSPFLQGVRDGQLDQRIGVMWTGPNIRASDFTAQEAAAYAGLIGRTPIVWENWVARDFVPTRLFLGPFQKRNDVVGAVQGFFFNPANQADLNMLPLATAGAWMQDPEGYAPRTAWTTAVTELARGAQPLTEQLRAWAETSYSSGLLREESPTFERLQANLLFMFERGARWTEAADALRAELARVMQAPVALTQLRNPRVAQQATPWLSAARQAARTGRRAVDLLAAERPALTLRRTPDGFSGRALAPDPEAAAELSTKVAAGWAVARAARRYVYGCRVRTRGCGVRQYNRMDDFLTRATGLDAAWLPTAPAAARRVRVTAGDARVRLAPDGTFSLEPGTCGARVLARDGAGGETSLPLPRCPRKPAKPDRKDRPPGR